jgi:hypothetical protein
MHRAKATSLPSWRQTKEAHLFGHHAPKAAKIFLRQSFKMKLRSFVYLPIKWISLFYEGRNVVKDGQLDWSGLRRRSEFSP